MSITTPPYEACDRDLLDAWHAGVRVAEKRAVLLTFLDAAGASPVLVHFDATHHGVVVAPQHAKTETLTLRIGRVLNPMISDLEVDRYGWSATLTFAGQPVHCQIPWGAVYALSREGLNQSASWLDDAPQVIRDRVAKMEAAAKAEPAPPTRPALKLVP